MFSLKKFFLALIFFFALAPSSVLAQDQDADIHFFWGQGCPHCEKERVFLQSLGQKYPKLKINSYEVHKKEGYKLLQEMGKKLNADVSGIPFTVIGDQYIVGFLSDETTGAQIEQAISSKQIQTPQTLKLPLIGTIQVKNFSLPLLTFIVALLDGFNPCAMWTLLFLINLLLGLKNRRRMWILGTAFIVTSAFVYFLFLSAWLNLFLFLGFLTWVKIIVGLIALICGSYYLKEYFVNKTGACKITGSAKRQRVFARLKTITQKRQLALALVGIILLAFAVNLVELICSAGLPAVYTQILSLTYLPRWQYYLYLIFYIFIFMLDDLFIFFVAMTTLKAVGLDSKYTRYSHLIGGILMLTIGLLMLFKPELLMFG